MTMMTTVTMHSPSEMGTMRLRDIQGPKGLRSHNKLLQIQDFNTGHLVPDLSSVQSLSRV